MKNIENENAIAKQNNDSLGSTMMANSVARTSERMMIVAKSEPRDELSAYNKIVQAFKRPSLAGQALYQYPRGGQRVTGLSIRAAENVARLWGNMDYGVLELEQNDGDSIMMAFAHDLETNVRTTKVFTVKHSRQKRDKTVDFLTDPRDIYEMNANQASRRVRACILAIIPIDILDAVTEQIEQTLSGQSDEPLSDRLRKLLTAFGKLSVDKQMIESFIGYKIEAANEQDFAKLRNVHNSIKDGISKREDWFVMPTTENAKNPFEDEQPQKSKK